MRPAQALTGRGRPQRTACQRLTRCEVAVEATAVNFVAAVGQINGRDQRRAPLTRIISMNANGCCQTISPPISYA